MEPHIQRPVPLAEERLWLMGDFNSPAHITGQGRDLILASGWFDAYDLAASRDSGVTVANAIDGWREQGEIPGMRIDYIWTSRRVPVISSQPYTTAYTAPLYQTILESSQNIKQDNACKNRAYRYETRKRNLTIHRQPSLQIWNRLLFKGGLRIRGPFKGGRPVLLADSPPWGPPVTVIPPTSPFPPLQAIPISLAWRTLYRKGVLTEEECSRADFGSRPDFVDYAKVYEERFPPAQKSL